MAKTPAQAHRCIGPTIRMTELITTLQQRLSRIIRDGKAEEILRDKELLEENGLELPLSLVCYPSRGQ